MTADADRGTVCDIVAATLGGPHRIVVKFHAEFEQGIAASSAGEAV